MAFGWYLWLASSVTAGMLCAFIAQKKNKDPLVWFVVGAMFNVLALLAMLWYCRRQGKSFL